MKCFQALETPNGMRIYKLSLEKSNEKGKIMMAAMVFNDL